MKDFFNLHHYIENNNVILLLLKVYKAIKIIEKTGFSDAKFQNNHIRHLNKYSGVCNWIFYVCLQYQKEGLFLAQTTLSDNQDHISTNNTLTGEPIIEEGGGLHFVQCVQAQARSVLVNFGNFIIYGLNSQNSQASILSGEF